MIALSGYSTPRARGRRGSALILVVMLLAAISVLLASLLTGVDRAMAQQHAAWRDQTTRALAEAGVQRAAAQLAERAGAYAGEKDTPLGGGFYSTKVSRGKGPNDYTIRSVGTLRDGAHTLRRCELSARVVIDGKRIGSLEYESSHAGMRSAT